MTIEVTPESSFEPPRIRVDIALPTPGGSMQSVSLYRRQSGVRTLTAQQPQAGLDARTVYDYQAQYEVPCTYEWEATYLDPSLFTTVWNEDWTSLAAWSTSALWSVDAATDSLLYLGLEGTGPYASRPVAPGRYQIRFPRRVVGYRQVNFGSFLINFRSRRIGVASISGVGGGVMGSPSAPIDPGTGAMTIDVTPENVVVTTTAGVYSLDVPGLLVSRVLFGEPYSEISAPAARVDLDAAGFSQPASVAIDGPQGWVYVVDFDPAVGTYARRYSATTGALLVSWLLTGTGTNQANGVESITVHPTDGTIYTVARQASGSRVQKWSVTATPTAAPTFVTSWATGAAAGALCGQISLDDSGSTVIVPIRSEQRVRLFSNTGTLLQNITRPAGDGVGQFREPVAGYFAATNSFNVIDAVRNRNLRFDPTAAYAYAGESGTTGLAAGEYQGVGGVANDRSRNPWVADSEGRFQHFAGGTIIDSFTIVPDRRFAGQKSPSVATHSTSPGVGAVGRVAALVPASKRLYIVDLVQPNAGPVEVVSYGASDQSLAESSDSVTLESARAWLVQPQNPALSFPLERRNGRAAGIVSADTVGQRANSTVHQIVGQSRAVTVTSGPRGADDFILTLATETSAERISLEACLRDQIPLLLQVPPSWDVEIPYGFFHVADVSIGRRVQMPDSPGRLFSLPLTAVDAPAVTQANVGWSWATLAAEFPTWADVFEAFETWADVLVNNRKLGA